MSHYGVRIRVFLDSVGDNIQQDTPRGYSLRVLEDGSSKLTINSEGAPRTDPIGIMSLGTSESFQGHSASADILMGTVGGLLRGLVEAQDCLRIEADTGSGFRCLFDGFVSSISWSETSSPQGFSWRLNLRAEGLQKLFQQGWLNYRMATTLGEWDQGTKEGIKILNSIQQDQLATPPQKYVGLLLDYGVSKLMNIQGRDGYTVQRNSYWQLGNFGEPGDTASKPLWANAMGLKTPSAMFAYLQAEGPLWQTVTSSVEPELHEFFITYAPRGGRGDTEEIPTVVLRPIPFPGPANDPTATRIDPRDPSGATMLPGPGLPSDVSYPDDNEWKKLFVLKLGGEDGPGPTSISSSKSDGERKNMFSWSMASAMDGTLDKLLWKAPLGIWVDWTSIKRYGFSSDQVTTSVYDRNSTDWLNQQVPRVLARVAFQRAPLPYLWKHTRAYPLLPGSRAGTVLEDATDGICGYITSVSHQIHAGPPGAFKAGTSLIVERVAEGCTADTYPDKVRSFLWQLTHHDCKPDPSVLAAAAAVTAPAPPPGGFTRVSPTGGALTRSPGFTSIGAPRRGGSHQGVDYLVSTGTTLKAPCDGRLTKFLNQPTGAGLYVEIIGDDGCVHKLCHLSSFGTLAPNQRVMAGVTVLGLSGATGDAQGAHLHWQIMSPNGKPLDPALSWIPNGA